ncbi:MAG TPA: hypothetical protein VHZ52_09975 [Acidobacteriaceae bacterium]|jgi:hypothetical protein|nr:hypothetical protein [Acidobacteriaceae bacterium]
MKFVIASVILLLIAVSFYADYRWKQWIARRKQERDHPPTPGSYD